MLRWITFAALALNDTQRRRALNVVSDAAVKNALRLHLAFYADVDCNLDFMIAIWISRVEIYAYFLYFPLPWIWY